MKNRKIILTQRQSPGDILTFSRAVAELKMKYPDWEIDVRSPCPDIFLNNPRLSSLKDNEAEKFDITYDEIHASGKTGISFLEAFIRDVEKKVGVQLDRNCAYPELWLSKKEKNEQSFISKEFGWDGPYWVLNAGRKPDNELKQYHRWQEVVDLLNEFWQGKVKIVQVGHRDHIHPKLKGTLNAVGKTTSRELIKMCYNAEGTIGPISFQFVISAALRQPAVVIAGGKEGVRWQIYPHIQYIYSNGLLKCCESDGCWLGGKIGQCQKIEGGVPKCFQIITPGMIADRVKMYYGGDFCKIPDDIQEWENRHKEVMKDRPEEKDNVIEDFKSKKIVEYLHAGQRNLIVFWHGLGDLFMFLPVFEKLKKKFPAIKFDLSLQPGLDQEKIYSEAKVMIDPKAAKGYDYIFVLAFPMSESEDITKAKKCMRDEIGIEIEDCDFFNAEDYCDVKENKKRVGVSFQGTCLPGSTNPTPEMAKQIWNEIKEAGFEPMEIHLEHTFHNPVNKKYDFVDNHIRNKEANLDNLISYIKSCHAFIGVASGPFVVSAGMQPTLFLEKNHKLSCYTDKKIAKVNLKSYKRGSIKQWLLKD